MASTCSHPTKPQLHAIDTLPLLHRFTLPARITCRSAPVQLEQVLGGVQQALALLAQQREQLLAERGSGAGGRAASSSRLHWLLLAAAGYGQSLLSKADIAALLLSRRILLLPADAVSGRWWAGCSCGAALQACKVVQDEGITDLEWDAGNVAAHNGICRRCTHP